MRQGRNSKTQSTQAWEALSSEQREANESSIVMPPSVYWDTTALPGQRQSPTHRDQADLLSAVAHAQTLSECPCCGPPCPPIPTVREDITADRCLEAYRDHRNELCLGEQEGAPKMGLGLKAKTFHSSDNVLLHTQQKNLNILCSSEKGNPYRDGTG